MEMTMNTISKMLKTTIISLLLTSSSLCFGDKKNMTHKVDAKTQWVIARILNKDFTIQNKLSEITNAQPIADLMNDEDVEVRELALHCLAEIGGHIAEQAAIKALFDKDEQIQFLATRVLRKHLSANASTELLKHYSNHPNPLVRREIGILLAKLGKPIHNIEKLINNEQSPIAREGLYFAAAQSGNVFAQNEIFHQIKIANTQQRKIIIEEANFLEAKWILPGLITLLSDQTPTLRIGVDGVNGPEYLRICDLTINLVVTLSDTSFSFLVNQSSEYSQQAIDEVIDYLKHYKK